MYNMLPEEIINKMIYLPSNTSYGVINNRSNKSYGSIQEAIDDNNTTPIAEYVVPRMIKNTKKVPIYFRILLFI